MAGQMFQQFDDEPPQELHGGCPKPTVQWSANALLPARPCIADASKACPSLSDNLAALQPLDKDVQKMEVTTDSSTELSIALQQHQEWIEQRLELWMKQQEVILEALMQKYMEKHVPQAAENKVPGKNKHKEMFNLRTLSEEMVSKKRTLGPSIAASPSPDPSRQAVYVPLVKVSDRVKGFVDSTLFEVVIVTVVFANSVLIGVEVYMYAANPAAPNPRGIVLIGIMFSVFFILELILRLVAKGKHFFCGVHDWSWNWLDFSLVVFSLVEFGTLMLPSSEADNGGLIRSTSSISAMRIIRVARVVRVLRIARIMRFVLGLRLLVASIASTLRSLFWAIILLVIIIYAFAIYFTQAITDYIVDQHLVDEEGMFDGKEKVMWQYWGSLQKSMFTLFKTISAGLSWDEAVDSLQVVRPDLIWIFNAFIAFSYFAVLNVMTGVFCQSAIENAQQMQDVQLFYKMGEKEQNVAIMQDLFRRVDVNNSGLISLHELQECLQHDSMINFFATMDLQPHDLWMFFKLLDLDDSDEVDVEEFVAGCLRLKGSAKAFDIAAIRYEHRWLSKKIISCMTALMQPGDHGTASTSKASMFSRASRFSDERDGHKGFGLVHNQARRTTVEPHYD